MNYGNKFTSSSAIFNDFPTYYLRNLYLENGIFSLIDVSQNGFVCYPNLVKMFYVNLNHKFYIGNEGEVWSSVNGTHIILNNNLLGVILGYRSTEMDLLKFLIDEINCQVFHDIFKGATPPEFKNWNS